MKKLALLPILAVAVVLGGCTPPKQAAAPQQPVAQKPSVAQPSEQVKLASTNYMPYAANTAADAAAEGKDVAVFFHSKTCGSCAKLDGDIMANAANIPEDVVILKADWDEHQALAAKLKVEKYHTVSYLGDEVKNVKGLFTLDELVEKFAEAPVEANIADAGYIAFTEANFAKAQAEGKDVAVFFHSKTCGSCAKLDGDIMANAANIPEDVVILKADWDENQDLATVLKVDKYHTVTVFDEETSKNVKGLFTLEELMGNFAS